MSVAGCSIGPSTVSRDRFDYSAAIAESWKRQMLLNLVKLRYGDPPVFLVSGAVGMRVQRIGREEALVVSFRRGADPSVEADIIAARELLGLDPTASDFRVVYGAVASNNREIAILSYSILDILVDLSSFISVPDKDVAEQRVSATAEPEMGPSGPIRPLIRTGSSPDRPSDAFVGVPYRNWWFWVDDRDIPSKRLFGFLMFIFTLVEPGAKESPPFITIPAG